MLKRILRAALFMLALTAGAGFQPSWAQSFPVKPITLICPWPAGGRPTSSCAPSRRRRAGTSDNR